VTDTTVEERPVTAAPDAPSVFPVTSVALVLIAVSIVIKAWATFGSWFYEDDFFFLSAIAQGQNDLEWYFTRHNVHFMPLSFLLTTPVAMMGGFAWWPAALEIVLMYSAGAVACWWMLVRLFGSTPRILVPLTFYLFSPFMVPAVMWWAVAINVVAVQAPLFVLIASHVEYLRTRRRRWLMLATLMLVLISGFYVKSLIVTVVLGLFTAAYATEGRNPLRRLWTAVVRWWPIWAAYIAVGLVVAWAYLRQDVDTVSAESNPDFNAMFENAVLKTFLPGLVGGPWEWLDLGGFPRSLSGTPDLGVAVSVTLLAVALGYAVHRWRSAWLPLVFLAPPLIFTFAALALLRGSGFSSLVGLEPKYWADVLPYLVLAIGVVLMPIRGLPRVRVPRATASPAIPPIAVLGVGAAYVVSSLTSTMSYVKPWHDDFPARQYVSSAVGRAELTGDELVVADVGAPDSVISASFYPYNTASQLFAPAPGTVRGVEAGVDLRVLDPLGQPVEALPEASLEADFSSEECYAGTRRLDLPNSTFDYPFWATITATFDESTTAYVSAGTSRHRLEVPAGRHRLTFRTTGAYDHVYLVTSDGAKVCPETIRIGAQLEIP